MHFSTRLSIAAALMAFPAAAMADNPPKNFDINEDKFLSGGEITEYRQVLSTSPHAVDAVRYDLLEEKVAVYAATGLIPISELSGELERGACDFTQRIFIRRSVIDLPLAECEGLRPKSDGAAFTLSDDRKANITTVDVEGGIGLVLLPARTFKPSREGSPASFRLLDLSVSAFGEGDGTFETDMEDDGYVRGGGKVDWLFAGAGLDRLAIATAVYYQSDLSFGSSGYGAQFTAAPQKLDWYLNAFTRGKDDKRDFVIRLESTFDAFHVTDAGATALTVGDYAWLGGKLGFEYVDRSLWEKGIVLGSNVQGYWDAVAGQDALLWTTDLNLLLDPEGRASVGLEYKRGTMRQNPAFQDVVSLNFALKF